MTSGRALWLCAALAACSSVASQGAPQVVGDAGREGGDADGGFCGAGDVWCGGLCVQESVEACGAACRRCAQPAASHGTANCVDGQCTHVCEGGYASCGPADCCGAAVQGDVRTIAVGGGTSCGITVAGAALCWGDGAYGTLGNGDVQYQTSMPGPVIGLGAQVAALSLGDRHACALTTAGAVVCWGDDQEGQLGDGGRTPRSNPVTPYGLSAGVVAVSAGAAHTCVVTTAGGAKCWGDNSYGQLGIGATSGTLVPSDVQGLSTGMVAIAAGGRFTCALSTGGTVKCWGDGTSGELGGPSSSSKPVDVALPAPVKSIAAGDQHVCALAAFGGVFCWGSDDVAQFGLPSNANGPARLPLGGPAVAISAGGNRTCVVDATGAVLCWGAAPVGDTGDTGGAVVSSLESGIASVAVVAGHACAVTTAGAPKCWGTNAAGELGDGTTIDSWAPVDVRGL